MKRAFGVLLIASLLLAALGGFFLYTVTGQDILLSRLAGAPLPGGEWTEPFDGLRVFMCGTASPLPAAGRAQACVAVLAGESMYVVDAGAGSALTLALARLPMDRLRAALLTHFPYRVAHHGADLLPPHLGVLRPQRITPGPVLQDEGLVITALEADHAPVAPAVAYRFDYRGRSVAVSGDTLVTDDLLEFVAGVDLLLHDALSLRLVQAAERAAAGTRMSRIFHDIQDYHASVESLDRLTEPGRARQLALYHLIPAPQNLLFERVYLEDMPDGAILTEDGMSFELPAGTDAVIW